MKNVIYNRYAIEENEQLYGPGKKLVLWVQGCSIHCKGCTNSELWDKNKGKTESSQFFVDFINDNHLDGIVFHGGEPMEQADALLEIGEKLKNKIIVCFTGYELNELTEESQENLANISDFLITGRFEMEKRNPKLQFRGSENQQIYFPSGKYKDYKLMDNIEENLIFEIGDKLEVCGFYNEAFADLLS